MNFQKLLPKREGATTLSAWAESWLGEVKSTLHSTVAVTDSTRTCTRNESLSAILPTTTTLIALYQDKVDSEKVLFKAANPKPSSGITEWKDALDARLADLRNTRDFLKSLRDDIGVRLSVSQSNLKNQTESIKHGG